MNDRQRRGLAIAVCCGVCAVMDYVGGYIAYGHLMMMLALTNVYFHYPWRDKE